MFTLVIGASASGKSEYAEKLVLSLPGGPGDRPRIYLATMEPFGEEAAARIARHRAARRDRGFETLERARDLQHLTLPAGSSVLLEDLGNLAANELFGDLSGMETGAGETESDAVQRIVGGIRHLLAQCAHLTVVTNQVFTGGQVYEGETDRYLRVLARANRELAALADRVVEVSCGLEQTLKEGRSAAAGTTPAGDAPAGAAAAAAAAAVNVGETGMMFVTGPLFSGKQDYVMRSFGWDEEEWKAHAARDVQDLAACAVKDIYGNFCGEHETEPDGQDDHGIVSGPAGRGLQEALDQRLEALAETLAGNRVVIATEVGGGVVPVDPLERRCREAAGRLACLLAARADVVVRLCCGIPQILKENRQPFLLSD